MKADYPADYLVLCWAHVERSMGRRVHVLQPGEEGGVGVFLDDEIIREGDLEWRRLHCEDGVVLVVPHDAVLDAITGVRVRVDRDPDGVLKVHRALDAPPAECDQEPEHHAKTPSLEFEVEDTPTELISLREMSYLRTALSRSLERPRHSTLDGVTDDVTDDEIDAAIEHVTEEEAEDATREMSIDKDLIAKLTSFVRDDEPAPNPNPDPATSTRDVLIDRSLFHQLDTSGRVRLSSEQMSQLKQVDASEDSATLDEVIKLDAFAGFDWDD